MDGVTRGFLMGDCILEELRIPTNYTTTCDCPGMSTRSVPGVDGADWGDEMDGWENERVHGGVEMLYLA